MNSGQKLLFVVQQHHAMYMHWDFRLEMEGVFVSWAIPDGPSINPAENRRAFLVEDHVYGYKDFEGVIPGAEFGSGKVLIWDQGEYKPHAITANCHLHENWLSYGKLEFILYGTKLQGKWLLTRTGEKYYDEELWLLIKRNDQYCNYAEIVVTHPQSVISGKTIEEINEQDGIFNINNYK